MSDDPLSESVEPTCAHPGCGLPERLHGAPSPEPPNPTRSTHRFVADMAAEPESEPRSEPRLLRDMPTAKRHDSNDRPMVGWVPHADYELLQLWVRARIEEQARAEAARLPLEWLALREAATDVRDNPVYAYDLPRSWQAQAALVDALAALDARLTAKGEPEP